MLALQQVKDNPFINDFIQQSEKYLRALGYTDHGFRHIGIVSDRAVKLAKDVGLSAAQQELAGIAGYCHDMGNFMGRTQHHYWSAILFSQIFSAQVEPDDLSSVMQAIVSHDKNELKLVNEIAAVLILADKSDVHRSRVVADSLSRDMAEDIHDRVNYAATENKLAINTRKKEILLKIIIDTSVAEPIDYFEIFIDRMTFCRQAASYLGYKFILTINNFRLS
ncbi:MAG: phosphohydrolase [Patescibacteria group bacterium]